MIIVKGHWSYPYISQLREMYFQEARLISIAETKDDKQLSNIQLRDKYEKLAIRNFLGKYFMNKDTQVRVLVSKLGIDKWHKKADFDREKAILIQALDKIIEDSKYLKTEPDYKNRRNIENSTVFSYGIKVNGVPRRVLLRTIKNTKSGHRFKYLAWDDVLFFR